MAVAMDILADGGDVIVITQDQIEEFIANVEELAAAITSQLNKRGHTVIDDSPKGHPCPESTRRTARTPNMEPYQ